MSNTRNYLATAIALVCFAGLCRAQEVPLTHGQALDKSVATFPQSGSRKSLLLLISFSHKGEKQCDGWNQRIKPVYLNNPDVDYYELADFQGVPSFVMHMVLHGMRRQIPKDEWPHFVPLYSSEAEWKKLVGYSAPEDAYLIVVNARGLVLWQAHGELTDLKYSELQAVIANVLPQLELEKAFLR